jgi:hypothetical protein
LQRPIPVHILYRTAWVDAQGRLQFRNDVYRRDTELKAALQDRPMSTDQQPEMMSQVGMDGLDGEAEPEVIR